MVGLGMSAGLLEVAEKTRDPAGVSFGPALIPVSGTTCTPASSSMATLEIGSNVGGSLIGRTFTTKLRANSLISSLPVSVVSALPLVLVACAKVGNANGLGVAELT